MRGFVVSLEAGPRNRLLETWPIGAASDSVHVMRSCRLGARFGAPLSAVLALAALAVAGVAGASAPTYVRAGTLHTMTRIPAGRSVGSPTDGHLIGGAHLEATPYLRIVPVYEPGDARWGLGALVIMLDDAARAVHRQYPDAVMSVGHLSRQGGGDIDRHASHESGRDADIGFYIKTQAGKPLYSDHFVPFKGDGTAPSWPGAVFDDARNWALVSALLLDPHARITYLFVATPIRARLLSYAERIGAPLPVRTRAAELMAQPRGSLPHDDHFHVRIGCPSDSRGCIELPTMAKRRIAHRPPAHLRTGPVPRRDPGSVPASNPPPAGVVPDAPDREDGSGGLEEGAPPAVLGAPLDDVDGPVAPRGAGQRLP
jgi:penicillin-insensitive murein endopeptidase